MTRSTLVLLAACAGSNTTELPTPDTFAVDGRTGEIDAQGTLHVWSKSAPGEAFEIARDVQSFQLLDWRVGVLRRDGCRRSQRQPAACSSGTTKRASSSKPAC